MAANDYLMPTKPEQARTAKSGPSLSSIAIVAVLAFIGWQIYNGNDIIPGPGPRPNPSPVVDGGPAVVFVLDGTKDLTRSQGSVAGSQKVQGWADDKGVEYRRIDVRDDLSRSEPFLAKVVDEVRDKAPEVVGITKEGKMVSFEVPDSLESLYSTLEKNNVGK